MILEELVRYYETCCEKDPGKMPKMGYSTADISYAVMLTGEGAIKGLMPLKDKVQRGKKMAEVPRKMTVPFQKVRSGRSPDSYFLADKALFILGLPKESTKKTEDARKKEQDKFDQDAIAYFERCKKMHLELLQSVNSPAAEAVKHFFESWDPKQAKTHPAVVPYLSELGKANLVFDLNEHYVQDDPQINAVWRDCFIRQSDGREGQCLVTGKQDHIATLHPKIKGVRGGMTAGTTLVGFNANAFESYGKEQGENAPVGEYAAFAYGVALNQLIASPKNRTFLGDMTVVYWSETAEDQYQDIFSDCLDMPEDDDKQINQIFENMRKGLPIDIEGIDLKSKFYILGLSPNAARLSVRFFMDNTFGYFLENLAKHDGRLAIEQPVFDKGKRLSVWKLLNETVNQNNRDKTPSPLLAGAVAQSVFMDTKYPMALYYGVTQRIKAEQGSHKLTWRRAAIIKAFFLKQFEKSENPIKECLTVSLNEETNNPAYVMGRLFSVLEDIQKKANPNINATIKDRYFNSACATPGIVFPRLINLSGSHLKKIAAKNKGQAVNYNKLLQELMWKLNLEGSQSYPKRLNLEKQGAFQLGYYHQTQKRYQKKEDKNND